MQLNDFSTFDKVHTIFIKDYYKLDKTDLAFEILSHRCLVKINKKIKGFAKTSINPLKYFDVLNLYKQQQYLGFFTITTKIRQ